MRTIVAALVAVLFLPVPARAGGLAVTASIFPLYEFAREVGGERVAASLLIPPGSEIHHWEPRPSDAVRLGTADLFIHLGAGLDPWAERFVAASRVKASLEAARGLPLRQSGGKEGRGPDPHPWLDFSLSARMVDSVASELSRLDPEGAAGYRENASRYKDRLIALELAYRKELASCGHREFVFAGHAAFGYLAARYGLTQVALTGLSPDSDPTPRQVAAAVTLVRRKGLPVVYYEPLAGPRLAEVLARETGAIILPLFPGHELTAAEGKEGVTFIALMERNLANLRKGLACE